ncbi:hypothetical protein FA048_12570 [Pedobacter polaris]|uniref:Uncharacterized protein n=1 Tax=Pedobacter polaris TaxID=2571273 RepID=A0A4U1CQK8_9SPHI|nr:hypothetical protein [Pedobacter polaris]TKC07992.1 hypothetical protein FA048_12570 [Pedobacter polaris]
MATLVIHFNIMFSDLSKIPLSNGLTISMAIFNICAPPAITIMFTQTTMFFELDTIKLIFFCLMIGSLYFSAIILYSNTRGHFKDFKNTVVNDETKAHQLQFLADANFKGFKFWIFTAFTCFIFFLFQKKLYTAHVAIVSISFYIYIMLWHYIQVFFFNRKQKKIGEKTYKTP